MYRLANFDISTPIERPGLRLLARVAFGLGCAAAMVLLRLAINTVAPTAGPFALVYPTVLLATLYGHWQAGLLAFLATFLWAWLVVLPPTGSLFAGNDGEVPRVMLNAVSALVMIAFAESFRRAVRQAVAERDAEIERRKLFHAEIEHRTRNNFALVASLLEIQKRRISDPSLHAPLEDAAVRVRTFADAYSSLAYEQSDGGEVAIGPYLGVLLDRVERAALPANVRLVREIDEASVSREVAVAIGLYVNEALANCAKYAFPDDRPGKIGVFFQTRPEGWRLTIEDDGVGLDAAPGHSGGLGTSLMTTFAAQAGGHHSSGPLLRGFRTELSTMPVAVA